MAPFPLFDLPPELVLGVLEASEASDLATFIRTSHSAWNIGHPVLYSGPVEQKQKALIWAAENNRPQVIELILDGLLPALAENRAFRKEVFSAAVRGGCCSLVKLLIEKGAEPLSVITEAVSAEQPEVVKLLLLRGVPKPTEQDSWPREVGYDIIWHCAALKGSTEVVELILASEPGLDVNWADPRGCTALLMASAAGRITTVNFLLAHNADSNVTNAQGHTALSAAARGGHTDVMQALLHAGAKVDGTEEQSPLKHAVQQGHDEAVELLLAHGATINRDQGSFGETTLHEAAMNRDTRIVRFLLKHGADVDHKDQLNMTPLCYATACHETCKLLLDAGASVEADGNIPLIEATIRDSRGVVDLLLAKRPNDFERTDLLGRTPLAVAAEHNRSEILQQLLDLGADVNRTDHGNQTPLSHAVEKESTECIEILQKAGGRETEFNRTIPAEVLQLFGTIVAGLRRP